MAATPSTGPQDVPISTLTAEIGSVLENLASPERLAASSWMVSCLVNGALRQRPDWIKTQALRAVFTESLDILGRESVTRADILRGRFWEGLTVRQMVEDKRPRDWQERNLLRQQASAIRRFGEIMAEREVLCRHGTTADVTHLSNHRRRRRVGVVLLLLTGVVVGITALATGQPSFLGSLLGQSPGATSVAEVPLSPTGVSIATPSPSPVVACGETERGEAPPAQRLLRNQGVSSFTVANTDGQVLSDWVRTVAIDPRGAWLGYFAGEPGSNGLGQFNKKDWADCNTPTGTAGMNVNDVAVDPEGRVWVAAEKVGVAMFDGKTWHRFTTDDGLPSADTFGLTLDDTGDVWVGTWDGVAKYDGHEWSTPYTMTNGTLFDNHVHAVAFDAVGNIWIGHIKAGVSQYRASDGSWVHHTQAAGQLGGNQVRSILIRPERGQHAEQVWIATADGGVSVYEKGAWRVYHAQDGLPSNDVRDLAIDRYDRVWAASSGGVAYFDDKTWRTYHTLDAFSVAIGPDCQECPFDTDQVLTATRRNGLTHSRIPLDTEGAQIVKVTYPTVVAPGQSFTPEVVVAPIEPYKLREDKGDMLINTDEDPALLFGAYEHIAVKGVVDAGKAYIFTAPDTPFIAPELPEGVDEQTFTSTWRVWMHTRYVGPPVHITFTVRSEP